MEGQSPPLGESNLPGHALLTRDVGITWLEKLIVPSTPALNLSGLASLQVLNIWSLSPSRCFAHLIGPDYLLESVLVCSLFGLACFRLFFNKEPLPQKDQTFPILNGWKTSLKGIHLQIPFLPKFPFKGANSMDPPILMMLRCGLHFHHIRCLKGEQELEERELLGRLNKHLVGGKW